MPPKGRGRPAKNTGQACAIVDDLQQLTTDQLENLKNVQVSFTCTKCGAKSPTLKALIDHLSEDCNLNKTAKDKAGSTNEDGTPRRGRGRPKKSETPASSESVGEDEPTGQPLLTPPPVVIQPEIPGRVTRMTTGSIQRKNVVELFKIKVEEDEEEEYAIEQNDDYEMGGDDDVDDADYRDYGTATHRARGRPPKFYMTKMVEMEDPALEEGEVTGFHEDQGDSGEYPAAVEEPEGEGSQLEEEEEQEEEVEEVEDQAAMSCDEITESTEPGPSTPEQSLKHLIGDSIIKGGRSRRTFKCDICKLRFFTTKDELFVHHEAHSNEPGQAERYKCQLCGYEAALWSRMLFHLVTHDEFKEKLKNTDIVKNVYGRFTCPYPGCKKVFDKKINMSGHWRKVHHKVDRMCEICGDRLAKVDEKTYIRHVEKCKNIEKKCPECNYTTTVTSNLNKHMKIHTGQGYMCRVCLRIFPTKQRLKVHEKIHEADRPRFMCEICAHTFCSDDAVKKHMARMHTDVKRTWKCEKCTYVAKLEIDLKKHYNIVHNKKYRCEDCTFMTNNEKVFGQHREYHLPDRIFPCPYTDCYFRGSTTRLLANHVSQIHNVRSKHQCPICMKFFKKKTHLLRHLVSHTEERPYSCRECGETFYSHSTYYRHRHKTGHDAKREGIVSVPQNITIQYLEEVPEEDRDKVQNVMANMPVHELESLLNSQHLQLMPGVDDQPDGQPESALATQTIVVNSQEEGGVNIEESIVTDPMECVSVDQPDVSEEFQSILEEVRQSQEEQTAGNEQQELVTYVLKMEGEKEQTLEVTVDANSDLAQNIVALQESGHQFVYEEEAQEAVLQEPAPDRNQNQDGQVQTMVEVDPPSGKDGEPQYAIVVWPEGDEPEAALSMLQLQSGNQNQL